MTHPGGAVNESPSTAVTEPKRLVSESTTSEGDMPATVRITDARANPAEEPLARSPARGTAGDRAGDRLVPHDRDRPVHRRLPPTAHGQTIERALSTTEGWVVTGIVLVLAALGEIILLHGSQAEEVYIPAVVMAAPVTFVRRLPRTAAVISTLATVTFAGDTSASWPVASVLGLMLVVGAAAYELAGRRSFVLGLPLPALLIGSVFVINAAAPMNGDDPGAGTFLLLILVTASMTFGALYRSRRAAVTERDATLQAHAATLREQSLIEERTRIARELHDVVAHHISSIAIQAETARFTTPGLPELGAERFAAIGDSARSALDEMRRLLGVMRTPLAAAELAPQPGLDQIDHLIEETRALGTDVPLHGVRQCHGARPRTSSSSPTASPRRR